MNKNKIILLLIISIVLFFIGSKLQALYGDEYYSVLLFYGLYLQYISVIAIIIAIVYIIKTYVRTIKIKLLRTALFGGLTALIIFCGIKINYKLLNDFINSGSHRELVNRTNELNNGDIIFQTSLSRQSKAIQIATKSIYSHCGIIYRNDDKYYVFEAIQSVKLTPLSEWIARGKDGKFVVKRLKNADKILTESIIYKMKEIGNQFNGKDYDLTFEWSDDKIYCSELIWKIYQRSTGLEIGKLQKLKDFDLTDKAVQEKMIERYGNTIPKDEIVISPIAIFESELLETVKSNE